MGSTLAVGGCWVMQETFEPGRGAGPDRPRAGHRAVHAPPPDRRARGAPRLGRPPTSRRSRCVFGKSAFARHPSVHGRPELGDARGLRPVGDVRVLRHPLVRRRPGGDQAEHGPAPARQRSCGWSTPTPAPRSASSEDGRAGPEGPHRSCSATSARPPTECFDADGFFHTGDAGHVDAAGRGALHGPPHRDDQDRRRQRVARRARGAAAGLPAREAEPHRRRARPTGSTSSSWPASPSRTAPRPPSPRIQVVPPRAGGRLQGAQARALLRRRRDPDDHQRHQGPRRRPGRAGAGPPRRHPCPLDDRRPMTDTLDASDLDQYMGVPMEPGELKDPVALNDIRRWVQAMHYPNPLHYDERWAAESHFGEIVAPQSFTVATDTSHGCSPAQVGKIPNSHLIFGGDDWWFFGPRIRPGDHLVCHRMPYDYRVTDTSFAGPTCFQRGDTLYINQRGERVALQRSTAIRYQVQRRQGEEGLHRGQGPGVDRRAAGRARRAEAAVHRPDPDPAPRPPPLREREGRRPAGRQRARARTASPASPPSGGRSR